MNRAALLRQRLGFDPAEAASFRATVSMVSAALEGSGLASTNDEAISRVNASRYVKKTLDDSDVWLHTIEAASSRFVADRHCFLSEKTLRNIADDFVAGIAFMTKHNTWGELPYGRTFASHFETTADGISRTLGQFYMLRAHRPNGATAPSTDDLHQGLEGGTLFDVSVGLTRSGTESVICDVCSNSLWSSACCHIPGYTDGMTPEEIAKQMMRGVPGGRATYTMDDWRAKEVSVVCDGAIANAGTAFSTQPENAHPREEETLMKYSAELKARLNLSADASDADVETALGKLQAAAADTDKLIAEKKKSEDELFAAKWQEKLTPEVFAAIKDLPTRNDLAVTLAKSAAPEQKTPPIGNPLEGANLSTTEKPVTPGAAPTHESEQWRKGLGAFESEDQLNKAVLTAPMSALAGCLGVKSLNPSTTHTQYDEQSIANRKSAYGIA